MIATDITSASALLFPVWMLAIAATAAVTDARTGLIPNWLTVSTLLLAPPAHLLVGGPAALGGSLLGAAVSGVVPLWLFSRRAIGGGDVKLLMGLGALGGVRLGLELQLLGFAATAGAAMAALALRGRLMPTLARALRLACSVLPGVQAAAPGPELMNEVRMGPFVFVATVVGVVARLPGVAP